MLKAPSLSESRNLLLSTIGPGPIRFVSPGGNTGDRLIDAGAARLLRGIPRSKDAETVVVGGSGGWCRAYHSMPARVARLESEGHRVIVLPSTFDVEEPTVCTFLDSTSALLFAREIRSHSDTGLPLAHCPSFFYDFRPYRKRGNGTLHAFRTDRESAGDPLPRANIDISRRYLDLDRWLKVISRHSIVRTDRAHVMIAAALMGKHVVVRSNSYFKVDNLAATWLADHDVRRERPLGE